MTSWIEENVDEATRIKCVLSEAPVPGVASLTYWISRDGQGDHGPFATLDAAIAALTQRELIDATETSA